MLLVHFIVAWRTWVGLREVFFLLLIINLLIFLVARGLDLNAIKCNLLEHKFSITRIYYGPSAVSTYLPFGHKTMNPRDFRLTYRQREFSLLWRYFQFLYPLG